MMKTQYLDLELVKAQLTQLAAQANFESIITTAFGTEIELVKIQQLRQQWLSGDFSVIPPIEILSHGELGAASGGYAASEDKIFISADFLAQHQGDINAITGLLLEEIGHKLDRVFNGDIDSLGDEGEIFSRLASGQKLSPKMLASLKAEDDRAVITVGGKEVSIEQQVLKGTDSDDYIYGGVGDDSLFGFAGNDTLYGNAGNDTLYGGTGNDILRGGIGNDTLYGGDLFGDAGSDTLYGEAGNDYLDGGFGNDYLYGGADNDTLAGGIGNDYLYGDAGIDSLSGEAGNDYLYGGDGNDYLDDSEGDNLLSGGSGNDTYLFFNNPTDGGVATIEELADATAGGNDTLDFSPVLAFNQSLNVDLSKTTIQSVTTGLRLVIPVISIENISGNVGSDTFIGNSLNNLFKGNGGNDTLYGNGGNDTLYGNDGIDVLYGGIGNDYLYGSDTLSDDGSSDILYGDAGNDYLDGGFGNDDLYGGTDNDTLFGGLGSDYLYGEDGDDTLNGYFGSDYLYGGYGNDKLYGHAGDDFLNGGAGNDTYFFLETSASGGVETIEELANTTAGGNDTLDFSLSIVNQSLNVDLSKTTIQTVTNGLQLVIPVISIENINGGVGSDTFIGNNFNNLLRGNSGDDNLYGGNGNDTLYGDAGNDYLDGGVGNDILYGGIGNDKFYFGFSVSPFSTPGTVPTLGRDTIVDFVKGTDKIVLSKSTFSSITTSLGLLNNFATVADDTVALTGQSSAAILYSTSTGNLFYNENGLLAGLGTNGSNFATVSNLLNIGANDFLIVN